MQQATRDVTEKKEGNFPAKMKYGKELRNWQRYFISNKIVFKPIVGRIRAKHYPMIQEETK